jgi:uncharacterized protein YegP (UPF0339 family)
VAAKIEIVKDKKGQYRFFFKASKGETIVSSESYPTSKACYKGIAIIQKSASKAKIVDPEAEALAKAKAEKAKSKPSAKNSTGKRGRKPSSGRGRGRPPKNPVV